jgi:hypothetical protein
MCIKHLIQEKVIGLNQIYIQIKAHSIFSSDPARVRMHLKMPAYSLGTGYLTEMIEF